MGTENKYPEHGKLEEADKQDATQTVFDFLEWLKDEKGIVLVTPNKNPDLEIPDWVMKSSRDLMLDFFGADVQVLEKEKRAMLEAIKKMITKTD